MWIENGLTSSSAQWRNRVFLGGSSKERVTLAESVESSFNTGVLDHKALGLSITKRTGDEIESDKHLASVILLLLASAILLRRLAPTVTVA